ncbi:MAG: hypothetical protein WCC87_08110 [Candidatus Korobacteraceae bacterium]
MRQFAIVMAVLLTASAVGHCKGTKLVASVKNPEYSGQRFKKVLVIGMSDSPAIRSDFEDAMANQLTRDGVEAVPGHSILLRPASAQMEVSYLKVQIKEHHIDAVLVSRLVRVQNDVTYIPGQSYSVPYPYYNSFYGYYGNVYRQVYTPDYLREDKTVRIETNLYATSTPEGEFVWTGISDTFNPQSAAKAIDAVVKVVVKDLEKEGIF